VGKSNTSVIDEELQKKKIKEMNFKENVGFSFGLKASLDSKLMDKRREKSNAIKRNMENIFDLENITIKTNQNEENNKNNSSDNSSIISVRDVLKEKKDKLKLLKMTKREQRMTKVQINQNRISTDINRKNENYILNLEKEKIRDKELSDDYKKFDTKKFSVTIDNYHSDDNGNGNNNIENEQGQIYRNINSHANSHNRTHTNTNGNVNSNANAISISNGNSNKMDNENKLEKSYISENFSRKERKMLFNNQRYNIENIRIKNVNKKEDEKINFPGPGKN
jgi:hypothetical protein